VLFVYLRWFNTLDFHGLAYFAVQHLNPDSSIGSLKYQNHTASLNIHYSSKVWSNMTVMTFIIMLRKFSFKINAVLFQLTLTIDNLRRWWGK